MSSVGTNTLAPSIKVRRFLYRISEADGVRTLTASPVSKLMLELEHDFIFADFATEHVTIVGKLNTELSILHDQKRCLTGMQIQRLEEGDDLLWAHKHGFPIRDRKVSHSYRVLDDDNDDEEVSYYVETNAQPLTKEQAKAKEMIATWLSSYMLMGPDLPCFRYLAHVAQAINCWMPIRRDSSASSSDSENESDS